MKLFSANIQSFRELYVMQLKKTLDMEQKITRALPDFVASASDPQLKQAFETHLRQTEGHVAKISDLLQRNQEEADAETCPAIDGLASEGAATIKDVKDPGVLDIALISAAQQVEHHEIAVYGTLKNWARLLGRTQDVAVLEGIESEEIETDNLLTEISESVNYLAAA